MKYLYYSLLVVILSSCSTLPNSQKIKTQDGTFTYFLSGKNKPTVVFESGLGDDMTSWQLLINKVDRDFQVFTYNRAGFSGSKSKNNVRNGSVIVKELRSLLQAVQLHPPYVLVGHSLGGAYMELYAKTYPSEVVGVVLVDPNSSKYPARCKMENLNYCDPPSDVPKWASIFLPAAVVGEIKGFSATHTQLNAIEAFPDVPLVVVSAASETEKQPPEQLKARRLYTQMHRELSMMSNKSKFVPCSTCGHYIHQEQPDVVLDAIHWVIEQ